ncbi:unnamed protein product [Calypogeia fissa]
MSTEVDEALGEGPLEPPEVVDNGGVPEPARSNSPAREANPETLTEGHHGCDVPLRTTLVLAYQTIGVVYGDLGTSPLYVYSAVFSANDPPSKIEILGCLSIIIYTITLICLIKYVLIVLRANDNGNGGEYALYTLICRHANISVASNQLLGDHNVSSNNIQAPSRNLARSACIKENLQKSNALKTLLLGVTILGTCMVIGDGVLTPCISVLSAIQGIQIAVPKLPQEVVVAVTCVILVGLFSLQQFGTDRVGYLFSPVVLLWFAIIALIGLYNIGHHGGEALKAFNPHYIHLYFKHGRVAWASLGGILLCITGTEAMFADLGHFSVRAIQIAFSAIVYPCLLCAYIGQAAYLLKHPENVGVAFFKSVPVRVYWPVFAVATGAAIIASQAMISAAFSLVYQAMNLGCFPRVKIVHTSAKHAGQVYIPEMNWLIMTLCIIIAAAMQDTSQIGNAYGVAVTADMVINTHLLTLVILMIWAKPLWVAVLFYGCMTSVELMYFSSVLLKVPQGGYIPIVFVVFFFGVMYIWHYGTAQKHQHEIQNRVPIDFVLELGSDLGKFGRVPGIGLVYTELGEGIPKIFHHLISKVPAMHSVLVFVCVKHLPVSHVLDHERFLFSREGPRSFRMYRCTVRFGYKELRQDDSDVEDKSFESLLVKSLEDFIMENGRDNNSVAVQIEGATDEETMASESSTAESSKHLAEELAVLKTAVESDVVYLLGHIEIRARKDSSRFRKFVIDYCYHVLSNNCRSSIVSLNIPQSKLLQVGMTYDI